MAIQLKFLILLILLSGSAFETHSQPDTLTVQNTTQESTKAIDLIAQGQSILKTNPDKALDLGLQALVTAKKERDSQSEAAALILLADANYKLSQFDNSLRYYNRALSLYTTLNNKESIAKAMLGIAQVYETTKNTELAIKQLENGIKLLASIQNRNIYIDIILKLGELYLSQGSHKRAQQFATEAQTILNNQSSRIHSRERILIRTYNLLGNANKNLGDLTASLENFKKASEIAIKLSDTVSYSNALREIGISFFLTQKPDSALQYFSLAYTISLSASDTLGIIQSLQGIGDYHFDKGSYNQAINYYTQEYNLSSRTKDIASTIASLVKISQCHYYLGDFPTSSRFLTRALSIAQENNLTSSKADVYRYLAAINEAQGRYKDALDYYKMWTELRDSIYYEETGQRLAKLQILYDITQKEKENEILKQNSEIQKLQISKSHYQMRFLISTLVVVAAILALLVMLYRNKQKEISKQRETEQRITEINKELERRMIQEIKKQEKQQQLLSQKSKLESLGTLAAGIAHEINQPLGGISMGLDNILMRIQDKNCNEEYLKEKLSSLFENVERIKKIIDHIRYFSRTQKPVAFTSVNLNDVVKSALFMVSAQYENHGVIIETNLDENLPPITADKYKLEQVMLNLLSNAKFAVDEKQKNVNDSSYRKIIRVSTWKNENFVFLSVWDNGTGIPQKIIEKIFDPFFTTKGEEKGTGLGLSISYGFIKDLLGEIKVESEVGLYTLFEISIPRE